MDLNEARRLKELERENSEREEDAKPSPYSRTGCWWPSPKKG